MKKIQLKSTAVDIRALAIQIVAVKQLLPFESNPREHSDQHVGDIAKAIKAVGMTVPILCDEDYVIIAGHGTLLACKLLGMTEVPIICLENLSQAQKIAFRIAHNKLCESGAWNLDLLASNFEILYDQELNFDLTITGFDIGAIDVARLGGKEKIKAAAAAAASESENVELAEIPAVPISRLHDRFTIDRHVVLCGDSRDAHALKLALGDDRADLALSDIPYNTKILGNVSGLGKKKHPDFVMASGEMDSTTYQEFIEQSSKMQAAFSRSEAYNCTFTGWYSLTDILIANQRVYPKLAHMCVWAKTNGGLGMPWRNAWEGILVYRVPGGKVINNVMLGKHGRNRTDVFNYAGVNTFRAGRMEELEIHPTCKPVALLADLIIDITSIGGIVLDTFLGSGSTILAAHETKRRGVGIELDPKYVDVAILRPEKAIGKPAIHQSGKTFTELSADRRRDAEGEF